MPLCKGCKRKGERMRGRERKREIGT